MATSHPSTLLKWRVIVRGGDEVLPVILTLLPHVTGSIKQSDCEAAGVNLNPTGNYRPYVASIDAANVRLYTDKEDPLRQSLQQL